MTKLMSILLPLLLILPTLSCERRPMYSIEEERMEVIVKVLWKVEVYPEGVKPSGVTLYYFRNGEYYSQQTTADVDSCTVRLEPGRYRLYMISQSPDEYGYLKFDNLTDFDKASVSVLNTDTKWYSRSEGEELLSNPEMMTVGVSDEFEITEDMVDRYHYTLKNSRATKGDTSDGGDPDNPDIEPIISYYTVRIPVHPKSIVSQYWITIYSDNADVLQSVRASTTGMAKTFELTKFKTGSEEGTQFITHWSLTIDDPITRTGHVDGKITTFGFPNGELPSPQRDSTLNVSALLIDYKTVENYVFNVGDKITLEDPPEGYRSLYRLIFGSAAAPAIHPPDVRPPDNASGFDAEVGDWEEGDKVDIIM